MPRRRKDTLDCCKRPALVVQRKLVSTARRDLTVDACASCGAAWLHECWEVAMNGDFDELDFHKYAKLSPEEATAIPASPSPSDLAFLADRDVLASGIGGLSWRKGWGA